MMSIANETLRNHVITVRFAVSIVIRHSLTLHVADRRKIARFVFAQIFFDIAYIKEYRPAVHGVLWVYGSPGIL